MGSRSDLHMNKLGDFADWLETQGWIRAELKGQYEVLRMTKPMPRETLIVHRKVDAKEHLTIHGPSEREFRKWMNARREAARIARKLAAEAKEPPRQLTDIQVTGVSLTKEPFYGDGSMLVVDADREVTGDDAEHFEHAGLGDWGDK